MESQKSLRQIYEWTKSPSPIYIEFCIYPDNIGICFDGTVVNDIGDIRTAVNQGFWRLTSYTLEEIKSRKI